MVFHPDMGYVDYGIDLTDVDLYKTSVRPFGQASILPPFSYQSKIFSDLEDEKLWTRSWIAIGSTFDIPNTADLLPYTVGHHGVHVQRAPDGGLTGRFNKAQHGGCRSVPLQCQTGKKTKCSFTSCGYSLDSNPIRAEEIGENTPTMHQYLGLIPERLLPVRVETWNSFVFINLEDGSADLSDSIPTLPGGTNSILEDSFILQSSEWFRWKSNWKLAGRAFLESQESSENLLRSHCPGVPNGFLTTDFPVEEIGIRSLDKLGDVRIFWLFPNLLLTIHPSFIFSVVIQPVAMGECLLRTALFIKRKTGSSGDQFGALPDLSHYVESASVRAETMQKHADKLTAPGAPEVTNEMIPIENCKAGYDFHQFLVNLLEVKHDYHWNAPLFSPRVTR